MRRSILGVSVLLGAGVWADTAFKIGEWKVAFAAEGQSLRLVHAGSGAEIVGELAFAGADRANEDGEASKYAWTVPESFTHRKVGISEGVTATARKECGGKVIAVMLTCPQTRTIPVTLQF